MQSDRDQPTIYQIHHSVEICKCKRAANNATYGHPVGDFFTV